VIAVVAVIAVIAITEYRITQSQLTLFKP